MKLLRLITPIPAYFSIGIIISQLLFKPWQEALLTGGISFILISIVFYFVWHGRSARRCMSKDINPEEPCIDHSLVMMKSPGDYHYIYGALYLYAARLEFRPRSKRLQAKAKSIPMTGIRHIAIPSGLGYAFKGMSLEMNDGTRYKIMGAEWQSWLKWQQTFETFIRHSREMG